MKKMFRKNKCTADDEEPNCGRCEHLADNFDCVHFCGAEHGWYGYERIELIDDEESEDKDNG